MSNLGLIVCLLDCPPNLAEFRGALAAALGTEALLHSFLAVRRSEWEHFGEAPLETEAALLYARY